MGGRSSGARKVLVGRAVDGLVPIVLHEAGSLQGHVQSLIERLRVAGGARSLTQLVRDQADLMPESRTRWRRDHEVRCALWRGLWRDLAAGRQRA